ncbi:unnamed protein product [Mesocestoides corti]|uniref:Anaphase-promoting complex subunit 4 n=1 Tax=Mesocestoides corti TaxID=53468 RepID=A0A158QVJ7_MESCO|nr:unnamed protein product [Mesocestoides corti]
MAPEFITTLYEERPIAKSKVSVAVWSPKMDIIAIGSPNGMVSLHRYKLGLTWEVRSPHPGGVTHLAWRPDGKVIAAAYEFGRLHFLNLLDGSLLRVLEFNDATIQDLVWVSCGNAAPLKQSFFPPFESLSVFSDDLFSNRHEVTQLSKPWLDPDSSPSVLVVYFDDIVRLFGCGVCEFASLKLPHETTSRQTKVCDSFVTKDMSYHCYFALSKDGLLNFNKISSRRLVEHCLPLRNLSLHVASLLHSKQLLLWSVKQLKNAWEDTLLELDAKLTAYSRERLRTSPNWSLRNELLEVILFGHVSPQLQIFLKAEWTPAAIRRAGIAMFKAYDTMKSITFQQLQYGLMQLICEASELLGCARDKQAYGCFGITEDAVVELIRDAGSTLQKTLELHMIVDHCSHYLRPFFKWLYGVAVSSDGTKPTSEKSNRKVTPTERDLIITFVSEQLRPIFIQGELKSYQIELVEQYIRTGGVTRPLEEVFGITAESEHFNRAKLRDIIPLPGGALAESVPEGVFTPTNASLADLIEVVLIGHIDKMAASGREQSLPGDFFDAAETPVPLMSNVLDSSRMCLCHFSHLPEPPENEFGLPTVRNQVVANAINLVAFVRPRNEGDCQCLTDSIVVYTFDHAGCGCGICIRVDDVFGDRNASNMYVLRLSELTFVA